MRIIKGTIAVGSAALSAFYLANVGAGVVEIIPDNLPLAGNIDEFIASLILLKSLAYFGWRPRAQGQLDSSASIPLPASDPNP